MATRPTSERARWDQNERVRRLTLERDRQRPADELLAEAIELSRAAMKLRAGAAGRRGR